MWSQWKQVTEMLKDIDCNSRNMTSGYYKLVFDVSQQLRSNDVEALQYIYKVSVENVTNLGVLRALEKRGLFSSSNIEGLKNLLCNIDRYDLLDMLKEDKRLELCYFQAVSMEEKLEAIRTDLANFCSKQECSPTERSFCGVMRDKVQVVQREMTDYLIRPLREVYLENTGELKVVLLAIFTRMTLTCCGGTDHSLCPPQWATRAVVYFHGDLPMLL